MKKVSGAKGPSLKLRGSDKNNHNKKRVSEQFCLKGKFLSLDFMEVEMLGREITDEEIRRVIFGMGSFKALGEDGFHALFYQSQWDWVQVDRSKYGYGERVMPKMEKKRTWSNLWNGVKHVWECFLLNCEMMGAGDMRWKNSIDGSIPKKIDSLSIVMVLDLEQMQLYRVVVFSEMKQVILWWAFLVIWEWVQFFNQSYEPSSMAFNLLENNRFCK
ncbi:hypothetical protein JHK82_016063 [Glycine max]|nr:hypothetical protein JHK85_016464 [Glycine max]KAG5149182.1 hypothetical protein JHK82_016063 [Glycine max]